jgi:hypothetical protein
MLCLPASDLLCAACFRDDQCEHLGDLCIDYSFGSFCARDCTIEECPVGYACSDVEREGDSYRQCLPESGSCADCEDEDGDGRGAGEDCLGEDCNDDHAAVYEDAPELADGLDNDCDTTTDEGTAFYDDDGDGWCEAPSCTDGSLGGDCNDAAPAIHPEAPEDGGAGTDLANGADDDCDGTTDETTLNYDDDSDGYCEAFPCSFGIFGPGDCDDADGDRHPGAPEAVNGVDDDCDGDTDEATAAYDDDGDGFCEIGPCATGDLGAGDCNDAAPGVYPGAPEVRNGVDDDCDFLVDEGTTAYDDDEDGYCEVAPCVGAGVRGGDCNDAAAGVHPEAIETRNLADDDCDGLTDEETTAYDDDGDGFCEIPACIGAGILGGDCNDAAPGVNPGAPEARNGADDDCDTMVDEGTTGADDDEDGYCEVAPCTGSGSFGGDCDDAAPGVNPGAPEARNGVDDDCDGDTDEDTTASDDDGDGYCEVAPCLGVGVLGDDCNDAAVAVHPGASEVPNGIDDDCDGDTDEGTGMTDDDHDGFAEVAGDCNDDNNRIYPGAPEDGGTGTGAPDGLDNDCDTIVDEGTTAYDDDGDGFCETAPCVGPGVLGGDCADANPSRNPGRREVCGNAIDDDCDGTTDVVDNDGDGATDAACGGADCDDSDPSVRPGLTEVRDAKDNDCDGSYDEALVAAGDVVVTEIMKNPVAVDDAYGEWFEVRNVSEYPVNLQGWVLRDDNPTPDMHTISRAGGVRVDAGAAAVLCRNGDPAQNGGVACDYVYATFELANGSGGDEVVLLFGGAEIDRVNYLGGSGWPNVDGASLNLGATRTTAADNDTAANWCATPSGFTFSTTDRGTPGAVNVDCAGGPALDRVVPLRGLAAGGETVEIRGNRLTGATAVRFGATSAAFTAVDDRRLSAVTPAGTAGRVDVTVTTVTGSSTLVRGFAYTGTASTLDFCNVQFPESTTTSPGVATGLVFGRVREAGVTTPAGQGPGILAELGYGTLASDPRATPGWIWGAAAYYLDVSGDDSYGATITPPVAGTFSYAYRFSGDGGIQWLYCDVGAGTADGFSTANLGRLSVL